MGLGRVKVKGKILGGNRKESGKKG